MVKWVKGGPIERGDTIYVELMSLLEGLYMVKKRSFRESIIEGDSKMVIGWGSRKGAGSWRLHPYL